MQVWLSSFLIVIMSSAVKPRNQKLNSKIMFNVFHKFGTNYFFSTVIMWWVQIKSESAHKLE